MNQSFALFSRCFVSTMGLVVPTNLTRDLKGLTTRYSISKSNKTSPIRFQTHWKILSRSGSFVPLSLSLLALNGQKSSLTNHRVTSFEILFPIYQKGFFLPLSLSLDDKLDWANSNDAGVYRKSLLSMIEFANLKAFINSKNFIDKSWKRLERTSSLFLTVSDN